MSLSLFSQVDPLNILDHFHLGSSLLLPNDFLVLCYDNFAERKLILFYILLSCIDGNNVYIISCLFVLFLSDASSVGNYDIKRCYKVNVTFHYNFPGGLSSSTIARERSDFSSLFGTVSGLLGLVSECNGVSISREDIATSPPRESNVFFRIPMIFTASNSIANDQVSSKLTSCINKLASYKGILDANAPRISQEGVTKRPSKSSTISDKESCCGGDTPPPCCAAGSTKGSTKCGRYRCLYKQHSVYAHQLSRLRRESHACESKL